LPMFRPISTDVVGEPTPLPCVAPEWESILSCLGRTKAPSVDTETRQQILLSLIFRLQRLRYLRRLPARYDLSTKLTPRAGGMAE
jgi:hypothetical protein